MIYWALVTHAHPDGTTPPHRPWSLPPLPNQNSVLQDCESFLSLIEQFRGGSDRGYYDNTDLDNNYRTPRRKDDDDSSYPRRDDSEYFHNDNDYDAQQRKQSSYGNQEYDYYDDRGLPSRPRRQPQQPSNDRSYMPAILRNGNRQIGFTLLGAGTVITMLGISLFFNKTLMRLGNLLFIAGVPMTIGPTRTAGYFLKPEKIRATGCLGLGIFLVFVGHPVFGIALEVFGLLNLFGNMFPFLMAIAKQMPILGSILNSGNNNSRREARTRYRDEDDRYYRDEKEPRRNDDDRYY